MRRSFSEARLPKEMTLKVNRSEILVTGNGSVVGLEPNPLIVRWAEAAAEATNAYRCWRRERSRESYFVYRASADRADAAQDALAGRS